MDVGGVRFTAYNAGHVLGAAMFLIEIAGVKVSQYSVIHVHVYYFIYMYIHVQMYLCTLHNILTVVHTVVYVQ